MTTISSACAPASTAALPGRGGADIASQLDVLQRKYADVAGCATTPQPEKQAQEAHLSQQMQALRNRLAEQQQAPRATDGQGVGDEAGLASGQSDRARNPYALVDVYA
ncbi:hypothetical protein IGB42_03446 [Andreprevotia sp. IGB-42]|uniref:hypothetical protein n=1 Tax=Andreprevotia sp. IGB-42 TaxID=2497473 RepID=UPI001358E522|nr:hypothetical protein [Andreprevotia sp. IGB-42]KAF0812168.1 hypothetical protein IGB42_03446 [Andreprevotia sp. IGB-42]